MIHPRTQDEYWYDRLPMGSSNSPGISGHFGTSFLRVIIDNCKEFQGYPLLNHPLVGLSHKTHLGEGRVLMDLDGLLVLVIWIHVDDVFIHGPSKAKLVAVIMFIMDADVHLDLIFQPVKTSPPAQVHKLCGFLCVSTVVPCLWVPADELSRALHYTG
jgi:hypothetical protein